MTVLAYEAAPAVAKDVMAVIPLPANFDLESAVRTGIREAFAEAARLQALKEKPFLTALEVEVLYSIKQETLKAWRRRGKGPRPCQRDKAGPVRYTHEAIREYLAGSGQKKSSTDEPATD